MPRMGGDLPCFCPPDGVTQHRPPAEPDRRSTRAAAEQHRACRAELRGLRPESRHRTPSVTPSAATDSTPAPPSAARIATMFRLPVGQRPDQQSARQPPRLLPALPHAAQPAIPSGAALVDLPPAAGAWRLVHRTIPRPVARSARRRLLRDRHAIPLPSDLHCGTRNSQ